MGSLYEVENKFKFDNSPIALYYHQDEHLLTLIALSSLQTTDKCGEILGRVKMKQWYYLPKRIMHRATREREKEH